MTYIYIREKYNLLPKVPFDNKEPLQGRATSCIHPCRVNLGHVQSVITQSSCSKLLKGSPTVLKMRGWPNDPQGKGVVGPPPKPPFEEEGWVGGEGHA